MGDNLRIKDKNKLENYSLELTLTSNSPANRSNEPSDNSVIGEEFIDF